MACETKIWLVLHLLLLVACYMQHYVHGQTQTSQVPCIFIFGDSLSDNGNNNNLRTNAKSNYNPYGVDFQEGPTGRFTNGKTSIDMIGNIIICTIKTNYNHNLSIFVLLEMLIVCSLSRF
ncbi:putative triacylglycerol lipase [Medicago truncatula]|uniref:Putative triacylglycerol lipase n=1 Tax=Medicago truncatula TaxID=3880 RepID=A0A396J2G3_MEDTR|nr:putative triacylglycerol lipase [Medicago truncatula]